MLAAVSVTLKYVSSYIMHYTFLKLFLIARITVYLTTITWECGYAHVHVLYVKYTLQMWLIHTF